MAIGEAEEQIGALESKEEQKVLTRQASALEPMVELEPGREDEPRAEVVQPAAGEDGVQAGARQQEEEHPEQQAEVPGEQADVPVQQADIPVQQVWGGRTEMIVDCLTKRGVKADALLDVITSGFLPQEDKNKKGGEDERRVV